MINKFVGVGRWTKDQDLKYTHEGKEVLSNTIAMQNPYNSEKSEFLNVVIFGKRALNTAEYTKKGSLVAVAGYIRSRSYENNQGQKKYVTELVADDVKFLEFKSNGDSNTNTSNSAAERYKRQSEQNSRYSNDKDKNPLKEKDPFPPGSEVYNDFKDTDVPF